MAEIVEGKPTASYVFETWGDFLDRACNAPSLLKNGNRASRSGKGSAGEAESLCATWEDAVEVATTGWLKGAKEAGRIAEAIFDKTTSMIEKTVVSYDVEGNSLDVGRYLDGEPECWQRFDAIQEEGVGQKIIKIVLNMSLSGGVPAHKIVRRGAAVLAVIEALEYAGHRVELWSIDVTVGSGSKHMETRVLVKRAGENLDGPRVAFAIAHPAMLRRMCFSIMETLETRELLSTFHVPVGYGRVGDPAMDGRGDIFINGGYLGEPYWENDESVKAWVLDQLRNQGVAIREDRAAK